MQLLLDRLYHPQPHYVFKKTVAVKIAALVCEIGKTALLGAVGGLVFGAHKRPCARADVQNVVAVAGNGNDRRAGVVCCGKHNAAVISHSFGNFCRKLADDRAWNAYILKKTLGKAKSVYKVEIPVSRHRTDKLGGGGVCVFGKFFAAQAEIQIIGDKKHAVGRFKLFGMIFFKIKKLINCVEKLFLNSRAGIKLLLGNVF